MSSSQTPPIAGYTPVFAEAGFNKYVGPVWQSPDKREFVLDLRDIHMNGGGALHGGMAMAMADIVMGRTVRDALEGSRGATVSLNCDFIGPAKLGERVKGVATITRKTRTIVFVTCELAVEGRPILTASGLWKILGAD